MLYERWRQLARDRESEVALREISSGRQWSFGKLARLVESAPVGDEPIVWPQGHSAEFIFAVLQAWRSGAVLCALEAEQSPPSFPSPPAPCRHLKLTSATTGAPRAVTFTEEQLAADGDNIVATMGLRPEWPNLGVISMAHSYGFSNLVLPLLLHGIPLTIVPSPLPEMVRSAADLHPAVTLAAVPALWRAWQETGVIPRHVRRAISAGAPLPLALEQEVFEATGLKIHNFYGSTECGGIAFDSTEVPRLDDACVGQPLRNVKLTLNDEGCLRVLSRAVGEGYWPDPGPALGQGVFQTSDLAEFKGGLIHLRGRASDQINVAGRKISPAAIERALLQHDSVSECLVFGAPIDNSDRTEIIVACVVPSTPLTAASLRQFLMDKLPSWQLPHEWWFVESLAANPRGKVSRAEWRRRFLERARG